MTKSRHLCVAAAFAATLAGCNTETPNSPSRTIGSNGQCFRASDVNGFAPSADGFVDVRAGASRFYRLELGAGCPNVNWSLSVGVRSTGGGSFICEGYDAELIVPDPSGTQRCPISRITPITREQYLASRHQ
jgi:Family of unknown function (DUF6491)